jgi:hypothetical protein
MFVGIIINASILIRPHTIPTTAAPSGKQIYLIAFTDHSIVAAVAYWVEGNTL